MSWHQVCRDDELAQNLVRIREAGLIPEEKIRLGIIGGGAPWIWKRCKETFPSAKEILDYYHCSEYVHDVANAHYGKETKEMTRKELKTKNLTTIFVLLNNLQKIGNAP